MFDSHFVYLKLVVSFVLAVVPIAVLVRDWKYHDKRTKRHNKISRVILSLWLLASFASLFFVWQETRESYQLSQEVNELIQGKNELLQANNELKTSLEKKTKQIVSLSEANVSLSNHISKSISGGNSFCYFSHGFPHGTQNILWRYLFHVGQYPLYDLNIRIVDGNKSREVFDQFKPPIPADEIEKAQTRIHKSTFFKDGQGSVGLDDELLKLPENLDKQTYSIFFTARNGSWHQQVSLRRVNGRWKLATRITRITKDNNKILLIPEEVANDFPRDSNGEVLW